MTVWNFNWRIDKIWVQNLQTVITLLCNLFITATQCHLSDMKVLKASMIGSKLLVTYNHHLYGPPLAIKMQYLVRNVETECG